MLDPKIKFNDVESNNIANHLKKEFRKVFVKLYDQFDVIESLSEIHAIYHVRFVKSMIEGPVGINPIGKHDLTNAVSSKMEEVLRRTSDADAYSPGPTDTILVEEVYEFILQQDGASLTDLNAFVLSFGATRPQLRYALKKVVEDGRVAETRQSLENGRKRVWYVPSENINLPPTDSPD